MQSKIPVWVPTKPEMISAHLNAARGYSKLSYCTRLKVGAVLTKDDSILSYGYNGRPSGEPNVCEIDEETTHPDVVHAERNALKKLYRQTNSSEGGVMYQTHSPCRGCAIEIVDAGITAVVYEVDFRSPDGIRYLLNKGVRVYKMTSEGDVLQAVPFDSDTIAFNPAHMAQGRIWL